MKVLVTGSTGHLGEALMRLLPRLGHEPTGLDLTAGPFTTHVGSICDRGLLRQAMARVEGVLHAATLHKPHIATNSKAAFVATNVEGTLALLEEAARAGVRRFVFTSTTSAFGAALSPPREAPAAWIDETVGSVPKNIYGVTKTAAEDLCALFARSHGVNCVVLRVARFFPEEDDAPEMRAQFGDANLKANEFLFRRVDIEDAALAHERALALAPKIGFGRYVVSAPTPFERGDLPALRKEPAAVVAARFPEFETIYRAAGFRMFEDIDRVYVSAKAQAELGWRPQHDFGSVLGQIARTEAIGSVLAGQVGSKGYHPRRFGGGIHSVE